MKTYDKNQIELELVAEDETERSWMKHFGPGLITGAADDDPSGIATYTQAGAQFGFDLLWTMLLTYPLMVAIQSVSARMGRVTGRGLATNLRRHYPAPILYAAVLMLLVANTINIAADLAAMGSAAKLLLGGPVQLYVVILGTASLLLQVFVTYERYARFLKWLTLVLFAYVAMAFVIPVDWKAVGVEGLKYGTGDRKRRPSNQKRELFSQSDPRTVAILWSCSSATSRHGLRA
jgi:NRAMP (natural resistance-associated macrophage protein)-like metal ion transporter